MIKLDWKTVDILLDEKYDLVEVANYENIKPRYVYVIETPKQYGIKYPTGTSRICYIGRSSRKVEKRSRIATHARGWMTKVLMFNSGLAPFKVHYCHPRRQNFEDAYKDIEAFMLAEFFEKFGRVPLMNKRNEKELLSCEVELNNNSIFRRLSKKSNYTIIAPSSDIDDIIEEE